MMWTPNQEHAIRDRARHMCIDAGAGSGKTRVLVDRIIHLIEQSLFRMQVSKIGLSQASSQGGQGNITSDTLTIEAYIR